MSGAARSVLLFGSHAAVMGVALLAVPGAVLPLLGLGAPREVWVRMLGFVLLSSAWYYVQAARVEGSASPGS